MFSYDIASSPPERSAVTTMVMRSKEPGGVVQFSPARMICHQKIGPLIFIVACLADLPAMIPFEFIGRLAETLERYFSPPVVAMKIESNMDTVTLLLNEMVEDHFPLNTESDYLLDLVPQGGLLSRLMCNFKSPLSASGASSQPSSIPWRRSNVRHTNNELYVDMVETYYAMLTTKRKSSGAHHNNTQRSSMYTLGHDSSAKVRTKQIVSRVEGSVVVTSNLSGVPTIQIALDTAGHSIDYPSFHPCVDIKQWEQSAANTKIIKCIPPDGKQLIASYTLDLTHNKSEPLVQVSMVTGLGVHGNEFEVRVWTRIVHGVSSIEGLGVNIVCDPKRTCGLANNLRVTNGDFHMNAATGVGEWNFSGKTPTGWSASLRGAVIPSESQDDDAELDDSVELPTSDTAPALFPDHVAITYMAVGQVPSGMRVSNLKLVSARGLGEGVKPYKGVRYTTNVGEYVVS